jgi:hypothetical protein
MFWICCLFYFMTILTLRLRIQVLSPLLVATICPSWIWCSNAGIIITSSHTLAIPRDNVNESVIIRVVVTIHNIYLELHLASSSLGIAIVHVWDLKAWIYATKFTIFFWMICVCLPYKVVTPMPLFKIDLDVFGVNVHQSY